MDFELSEELIAVRDLAREFAEKEIAPSAAKDDKEKNFRRDLVRKMGELGFYGTMIPETYGGNGLGFLAMVLITEEIARAHSAMRVAINMQIGPALDAAAIRQRRAEEKIHSAAWCREKPSAASRSPSPTPVPMWRRCARPRRRTANAICSTAANSGSPTRR